MNVKDIMSKNIAKVPESTSIRKAAEIMTEKRMGVLVVVNEHKLLGIVTEDDIIRKVVGKGKHPQETTVGEIMVKEVINITPEKTIEEAATLMTENKIKKLPVIEEKKLIGMLTASDMVAAEPKMMEQLSELVLYAKKPQRMAG